MFFVKNHYCKKSKPFLEESVMAIKIADAILHIDETLEDWQRDVLDDHMRLQQGVIATGYNKDKPHLMIIEYNPDNANPVNFIYTVKRHGYHAERIA